MHKTSGMSRLTAAYVIGVLLLSSIDVVYERFSPLTNEAGQSTDWYEMAGIRAGVLMVANHEGRGADGVVAEVHLPRFSAVPFFAGAGPEGGVMVIAVWFLGFVSWIVHFLMRLRARWLAETRLSSRGN